MTVNPLAVDFDLPSSGIREIERIIVRVCVGWHVVPRNCVGQRTPRLTQNGFRLQISPHARVVVPVPILEEVGLGVEVLPRKPERRPEGYGGGLKPLILVTLHHHAGVWEVWRLRAGAVPSSESIGATILRIRREAQG